MAHHNLPPLLALPAELTSEVISHLALPSPSAKPLSLCQSHWDAYAHHALSAPSISTLQALALTHTYLLPFCRSHLFRSLRVYPGMAEKRVTALADLFRRTPEIAREVRALWWTVGVEEYLYRDGDAGCCYRYFKYPSEEREARKAGERLELVDALLRARAQSASLSAGGGGLRKVWITGCESQRRFDVAQRRVGPSGLHASVSLGSPVEEGHLRVTRVLEGVMRAPALTYVSMVNIACSCDILRGCVNLGELRLAEDVTVLGSTAASTVSGTAPAKIRVLTLPSGTTAGAGANANSTANALFEQQWVGFGDREGDEGQVAEPVLDLSRLQSFSCQYPSPAFSAVVKNVSEGEGANAELKSVSLQVTDFGALVDDMENGTFDLLSEGRPLSRLSLTCTLPSSPHRNSLSPLGAPSGPPSAPPNSSHLVVPSPTTASPLSLPPTLGDRVSQLLTSLTTTTKAAARELEVKFTASVEQGMDILGGQRGLDLSTLANKIASMHVPRWLPPRRPGTSGKFEEEPAGHPATIRVNFCLVAGCHSSYGGYDDGNADELGRGAVSLQDRLEERCAEAVEVLKGVGVDLEVGYHLAA